MQNVSSTTLVSPMLENLERTANIIAPCHSPNSSTESGALVIDEKQRISSNGPIHQHPSKPEVVNNRLEMIKSPYSRPQIVTGSELHHSSIIKRDSNLIDKNSHLKPNNYQHLRHSQRRIENSEKSESIIDEEEEIDVVRLDDPCDPMWRPW